MGPSQGLCEGRDRDSERLGELAVWESLQSCLVAYLCDQFCLQTHGFRPSTDHKDRFLRANRAVASQPSYRDGASLLE